MSFRPYCPQCKAVKPDGVVAWSCGPCANRGHSVPLVTDESNRQWRIRNLKDHLDKHEYTEKERKAIPMWQNLNKIPEEALIREESEA